MILPPNFSLNFSFIGDSRLVHPEKAESPMAVADSGMVILVRLRHPKNALSPMAVTELGMVIWVRLLHPKNALSPMAVTELGMQYEDWVEQ